MAHEKNDIVIVIPAYNEGGMIQTTLKKVLDGGYSNIIVVNDGSKDNTEKLAKEMGVMVITHPKNRGLGGALHTGIHEAIKRDPKAIVTFDADGQHAVEDIEKIINPLIEENYDSIIGSRLMDSMQLKNMPFIKQAGNFGLNIITWVLGGKYVTDSQSGLRSFSLDAAKILDEQIKSERYEISSEFIILIKKNSMKHKEVPIQTIYTEYALAKGTKVITGFKIARRLIVQKFK